jgi:hypothetical protein
MFDWLTHRWYNLYYGVRIGLHKKRDLANLARAALAARMLWKLSPDWEPGDEELYVKSLVKSFEQSYLAWWD